MKIAPCRILFEYEMMCFVVAYRKTKEYLRKSIVTLFHCFGRPILESTCLVLWTNKAGLIVTITLFHAHIAKQDLVTQYSSLDQIMWKLCSSDSSC